MTLCGKGHEEAMGCNAWEELPSPECARHPESKKGGHKGRLESKDERSYLVSTEISSTSKINVLFGPILGLGLRSP